jgi:hypothetical protein
MLSNWTTSEPMTPIADFLPLSRLPMVCPSAPLTGPSWRSLEISPVRMATIC